MSKEKLVPNMRFKEFKDCGLWKKSLLGDELSLLKDGTHGTHKNIDSNYFLLSAKNIKNGEIYINVDEDRTISKNEFNKIHKNFKLNKNDILLTVVGSIGESAILKDPTNITFQRSVAYLRPNENLNSYFLLSMINTNKFQMELKKQQVVSAQPGVYLNKLNIIDITYPYLSEQQKIGNFFKKIDKMIQLQQSKVNKVKDIKSGYLSEMFPKEGEKYPKKRFEGFTGPWEYHYLYKVTQITMGQSPDSINYTNNPKDFILIQGNSDMKNGRVVPRIWTTQVTKKADKGDLILSVRAPVGDIGKTDYDVVLGRGVASIKGNDFIYQTFKKKKEQNYWDTLTTGSTFGSINSQDLKNITIALPSLKEQEKIGQFFKNLDNQISIEEEKLTKLEKLKQAYLNDMFV